jgi:hypothetical protein
LSGRPVVGPADTDRRPPGHRDYAGSPARVGRRWALAPFLAGPPCQAWEERRAVPRPLLRRGHGETIGNGPRGLIHALEALPMISTRRVPSAVTTALALAGLVVPPR